MPRNTPDLDRSLAVTAVILLHAWGFVLLLGAKGMEAKEKDIGYELAGSETRVEVGFVKAQRGDTSSEVKDVVPKPPIEETAPANVEAEVRLADSAQGPADLVGADTADVAEAAAGQGEGPKAAHVEPVETSQPNGLARRYREVMRAVIAGSWAQQTGRPLPTGCMLYIRQGRGGVVLDSRSTGCHLSEDERTRLIATVSQIQPLPYAGFESVFSEELSLEL